jgi:hypothetical protein
VTGHVLTEKLDKVFYECGKHLARLESASEKMAPFMPLDTQKYTRLSEDEIMYIDQFLFRFAKLQDAMGQKLFRYMLLYLQEEIEDKPFIDILNRMEKLGLIENAHIWKALREDRNELAHHYEDDPAEMSVVINNLYAKKAVLKNIYLTIKEHYQARQESDRQSQKSARL